MDCFEVRVVFRNEDYQIQLKTRTSNYHAYSFNYFYNFNVKTWIAWCKTNGAFDELFTMFA
jgi:hypothetical protein